MYSAWNKTHFPRLWAHFLVQSCWGCYKNGAHLGGKTKQGHEISINSETETKQEVIISNAFANSNIISEYTAVWIISNATGVEPNDEWYRSLSKKSHRPNHVSLHFGVLFQFSDDCQFLLALCFQVTASMYFQRKCCDVCLFKRSTAAAACQFEVWVLFIKLSQTLLLILFLCFVCPTARAHKHVQVTVASRPVP